MSRPCPICFAPMGLIHIHEVEVDTCDAGHGLWLDAGELSRIARAERDALSWWERVGIGLRNHLLPDGGRPVERGVVHVPPVSCPVEGEQMRRDAYEDVDIDRCEHGVWLDRGELELILERLKTDPFFMRGVALRLSDTAL